MAEAAGAKRAVQAMQGLLRPVIPYCLLDLMDFSAKEPREKSIHESVSPSRVPGGTLP